MLLQILLQAQSGFTTNWFFEKLLPSFIGAGGALTVFLLTTRRDKNKETKKKKDERADKMLYLKSLIVNTVHLTEQLLSNLEHHIIVMRKDTATFNLLKFTPLTGFVRSIDTLSKDEYYSSFTKVYKERFDTAKVYQYVVSNIDYIHAQFQQIPDMLEKAQKFDEERKEEYKEYINRLTAETRNVIVTFHQGHPPLSTALAQIFDEFLKGRNEKSDVTYYNTEFTLKIRNRILVYFENEEGPDFKVLLDLLSLATDTSQLYSNITLHNLELSNDLVAIKGLVSDSLNELMSESQKMK